MLVACMAMRYILQSLDSSSGKKNMYICNANMIIPFVNNRTPKKTIKYVSELHQQQQD